MQDRANKERSLFVSKCKEVWFKNDSTFALEKGDMKLNPDLVESGVATVEGVRKLLMSEKMYRNPVMYDLICGGVESGKLKYNDRRGPTTISKLMTIPHEASRTELWFALEKQAFRHTPTTTHIDQRKTEWLKCCNYVFQDRVDNEEQVAKDRRGDCPAENEDSGDDDDEEDELDTKYY